jgi:hypothetical protein
MLTNLESLDLPEMESETAEYLSELSLMTKLTHFGMQLDGGGYVLLMTVSVEAFVVR